VGSSFRGPRAGVRALAGVGLGVGLLAFVHIAVANAVSSPVATSVYGTVTATSLVVALGVTAASEWLFAALPAAVRAPAAGVRAEDAEVDELLRLIASAEDQLVTRHRTQAVVLISDIKSFSAMTEELGSIECAKVVQRHRDMLLPVIQRHRGKGKSTGGDGLLAAFSTPRDAVAAAIDMQKTLDSYSRSAKAPQPVLIRIGVAAGEVVLDSGGRPFLGAGLNLAARVMNLADGGRIMATADVAEGSGLPPDARHPHGTFELKNIATPVAVEEILWHDGQTPQET
jgi:class 3 adenylate cyclase